MQDASSYLRERATVDQETGCWNWGRSFSSNGYGNAYFNKKYILAHRLSYMAHKGPLIPEQQIDHLCRNKACINPDHLEQVSQQMNIRRAFGGVEDLSLCPKGHDRAFSHLDKRGSLVCRLCANSSSRASKHRHAN